MHFSPDTRYLFLDFDGVICDSLEECYRSSWLTAANVVITNDPPPNPPFDSAYRARFDACRPYIRSGEDYLVVHEWAAQGLVPENQEAFDRTLKDKGSEVLAETKVKLYAVRDALLARHHERWLGWNPVYPGMANALAGQVSNPGVWILSTKKAEFIGEILRHQGVDWPLERTIYTGPERKLAIIERQFGSARSVLIDDQVDHLDFDHPSCRCYLASWGYVASSAAQKAKASLSLSEAIEGIREFPNLRRDGSVTSARQE